MMVFVVSVTLISAMSAAMESAGQLEALRTVVPGI